MYTAAPGKNIDSRSATAITAIAFGWPSAVRRVPSSGSTATSTRRASALADVLAVVEHRRLVLLALADHDDAVHHDRVEHRAHAVDRRLVGSDLVAAADPAPGTHRSGLRDTDELERQVPIWTRGAHGQPS